MQSYSVPTTTYTDQVNSSMHRHSEMGVTKVYTVSLLWNGGWAVPTTKHTGDKGVDLSSGRAYISLQQLCLEDTEWGVIIRYLTTSW